MSSVVSIDINYYVQPVTITKRNPILIINVFKAPIPRLCISIRIAYSDKNGTC